MKRRKKLNVFSFVSSVSQTSRSFLCTFLQKFFFNYRIGIIQQKKQNRRVCSLEQAQYGLQNLKKMDIHPLTETFFCSLYSLHPMPTGKTSQKKFKKG